MRMLNQETDAPVQMLTVLLTRSEVQELHGILDDLLAADSTGDHYHLSSPDYQKEITVAIYGESDPRGFSERMLKLIAEDR